MRAKGKLVWWGNRTVAQEQPSASFSPLGSKAGLIPTPGWSALRPRSQHSSSLVAFLELSQLARTRAPFAGISLRGRRGAVGNALVQRQVRIGRMRFCSRRSAFEHFQQGPIRFSRQAQRFQKAKCTFRGGPSLSEGEEQNALVKTDRQIRYTDRQTR